MMFFIPFQTLISRWFDRRRGLAVGMLGTGFSLGGFVVVPIMQAVIDEVQWEGSFVVAGIAVVAVFVPLSLLLLRDDPADVGAEVDGDATPEDRPVAARVLTGVTVRQALRTPLFWVIAAALTAFFFGMMSWVVHGIPYFQDGGLLDRTGCDAVLHCGRGRGGHPAGVRLPHGPHPPHGSGGDGGRGLPCVRLLRRCSSRAAASPAWRSSWCSGWWERAEGRWSNRCC